MARAKAFDGTEVLNKAIELFLSKGYNGTSAQDIVESLGISRSSLYATFTDKRRLFLRALGQYGDSATQPLLALLNSPGDVRNIIRELFVFVIRQSVTEGVGKGCLMVNAATELAAQDAEVAAAAAADRIIVEKAIAKVLTRGQKEGSISADHPPAVLSRYLFNAMSGLRVMAKAGAGKKEFEDVVKVTLSAI